MDSMKNIKVGEYYIHKVDKDIVLVTGKNSESGYTTLKVVQDDDRTWDLMYDGSDEVWSEGTDPFLECYQLHKLYNSPLYKVING